MILDDNQYKIIVESAPNMIWRAGKDALCDYFNTTWLAFTGRKMEQEVGNGWAEGVHPEDFDRCLQIYLGAFQKQETFEMICRLKRHDGEWRWIFDRGVPFYEKGEFAGYIGSCFDINERITGETWKEMAQKDGLTGVLNKAFFMEQAKQLFDSAQRLKRKLCAVMIDIDNFKYINDRYGHPIGDKVLISFSGVLRDNIRDSDLLARYGGDEFIRILSETDSREAGYILNRMTERMTRPLNFDENITLLAAFSYGVVDMKAEDTFGSFIERADQAMYANKKKKKSGSDVHALPK